MGWQAGCRNDAVVIPSLWDSCDVTSDAIKRGGYSKPKRQSNKIANTNFSHPTKYFLWRGSWVSWKWCRDGNAIQFPSGYQDSPQANASLLLHGALPSSRGCSWLSSAGQVPKDALGCSCAHTAGGRGRVAKRTFKILLYPLLLYWTQRHNF